MTAPVDVLAGERDARTIYDVACIREQCPTATREDVNFKEIALRNYQFCTAVAEVIAQRDEMANALVTYRKAGVGNSTDFMLQHEASWLAQAALARVGGAA